MANKEEEIVGKNVNGIVLPTGYVKEYTSVDEKLSSVTDKLSEEEIEELKRNIEEELYKSFYGLTFSYPVKEESHLENKIKVHTPSGEKTLVNKEINTKVKKKGKIKGSAFAALAVSASGSAAKRTKWELYNSGFWVTIKPISPDDKVKLETRLVNELVEVGIDTLGLIFSNDQAAYRSILLDFLRPFIDLENSSIKASNDDDPYEYINALDADILVAALIYNLFPTGFPVDLVCRNNLEFVEDGVNTHTACNNVLHGEANALNCVYGDVDSLTEKQKNILSMGVSSIYKGDEPEYLEDPSIGYSLTDYYEPDADDTEEEDETEEKIPSNILIYEKGKFGVENEIKITLGRPTINRLLESADKYIVDLKTKIDDTIIELNDSNDKEALIEEFTDNMILNKYLHFIERIDIGENYTDELYDIFDVLNILRSNDELAFDIIDKISKYVDESLLSVIGHPKFTCSKCKKVMNIETGEKSAVESIIPFNILQVFTILRIM